MSSDVGIKISGKNVDVGRVNGQDLLLSSKYALAKLDTANPISFQNIDFEFINDPPAPAGDTSTLVYQIPHGYNYVPQFWSLVQVLAFTAFANFYQPYFQDRGIIGAYSPGDTAEFRITADEKFINFWVDRETVSGVPGALVQGTVLRIRLYVFADGVKDDT